MTTSTVPFNFPQDRCALLFEYEDLDREDLSHIEFDRFGRAIHFSSGLEQVMGPYNQSRASIAQIADAFDSQYGSPQ